MRDILAFTGLKEGGETGRVAPTEAEEGRLVS